MPDKSVEEQEGPRDGKPIGAGENTTRTFTRRKILATSAAAVVSAASLGLQRVRGEESSASDTAPKANFSLNGKSAIVTGAARGIGRAIAVALASAGADIMGVDIAGIASPAVIYPAASEDELNETGRLVEAEKRRFIAVKADTRDIGALLELGEYQITVNTLEPGLVDTPMTRNPGRWIEALKEAGKQLEGNNPREQDVIAARLPTSVMKIPWMQPADVAPVAVFLASDAAYRITGATYDATAGDSAKYLMSAANPVINSSLAPRPCT